MAKVKFGMMMTDASGKLGGQVFSKNRSGNYVRTKTTPSNPQSVAQQEIRAILASVSSGWSDLTQSQRASFNNAVDAWKKTDIFGDLKKPTGKNLYTALNINLSTITEPLVSVAPEKVEIPYLAVTDVDGSIAGETISVTAEGSAVGMFVSVSATAPQSAGTSYFKGKFRRILAVAGADINTTDFYQAYIAIFGVPAVGANIAFSFKVIAPNGQAGVAQVVKAVISA